MTTVMKMCMALAAVYDEDEKALLSSVQHEVFKLLVSKFVHIFRNKG